MPRFGIVSSTQASLRAELGKIVFPSNPLGIEAQALLRHTFFGRTPKKSPFFSAPKKPKKSPAARESRASTQHWGEWGEIAGSRRLGAVLVVVEEKKDVVDGFLEIRLDVLAGNGLDQLFQLLDNAVHFVAGDFLEFFVLVETASCFVCHGALLCRCFEQTAN